MSPAAARSTASWFSCSSSDSATPIPTAAATGRNGVVAKMNMTATCELRPGAEDGGDLLWPLRAAGREDKYGYKRRSAILATSPEKRRGSPPSKCGTRSPPTGSGPGGHIELGISPTEGGTPGRPSCYRPRPRESGARRHVHDEFFIASRPGRSWNGAASAGAEGS